ncbi:hypothetical protein PMAYCL1PPCAC_28484, partial [Pristionchus mayeri]
ISIFQLERYTDQFWPHRMGAKSKYVIVQLASVITGATRVWLRERAAEKTSRILFDPALGRECLFEEVKRIKGKSTLSANVKKMYGIEDTHSA